MAEVGKGRLLTYAVGSAGYRAATVRERYLSQAAMGDLDKEIGELGDKLQRTRYQFLKAELQTCLTALEMARFELSVGNTPVAEREIAAVEKGVSVIQRFLSGLSQDQRREVDANVAELNAILESVKADVDSHSR